MTPALVVILVLCGGVAGSIGWRRATAPIYRRPRYRVDLPPGVTRSQYDRQRRRRRRIQRVFVTLFYALAGALGGIVFLMAIGRH